VHSAFRKVEMLGQTSIKIKKTMLPRPFEKEATLQDCWHGRGGREDRRQQDRICSSERQLKKNASYRDRNSSKADSAK